MKKSKFTRTRSPLPCASELGTPVVEIIRKMGISEQTFYRWKQRYSGIGTGELRRLRQLDEENSRLKRMVAD